MINFFKNIFTTKQDTIEEFIHSEKHTGPHVVWIHGANQTSLSFAYLRSRLPNWDCTLINYSSLNNFYHNLANMIVELENKGPLFIVGHSLGGIYALHLAKQLDVVGAVSISTPFRGSSTADWAKYVVPAYQLFRDVGRRSRPIIDGHKVDITIPWTQIISTTGSVPYHSGPNDGVVTIASMEHRSNDMEIIHVNNTHYEVVCSDEVAKIIQERYERISR